MKIAAGAEISDRYELVERIASGGMAMVWRARDRRLDRDVAVKILSDTLIHDAEFVDRFEREAQIAAGLSHPNLVAVHDLGIEGDRPFLVMELIEGETLEQRLDSDSGSVETEHLAAAMLGALGHMHDSGIVHRDVKPANVIYDGNERPRLVDFGIAQAADATRFTDTGKVVGTLHYLPPEVREGGRATPQSDLYALGRLLERCGPGSAALSSLVAEMTEADPDARPASAAEARARLENGIPEDTAETEEQGRTAVMSAAPAADADPPAEDRAAPTGDSGRSAARPDRGSGGGGDRSRILAALPIVALIAALVIGIVLLSGGDDSGSGDGGTQAADSTTQDGGASEGGGQEPQSDPAPADEGEPEPEPEADPGSGGDPARGKQLNDQGFALLQDGNPEEARPILAEAVEAFPSESRDINYAFALFNYARALRLTGSPEEAIPLLEKRLTFDNQKGVVKQELRKAREAAEG